MESRRTRKKIDTPKLKTTTARDIKDLGTKPRNNNNNNNNKGRI